MTVRILIIIILFIVRNGAYAQKESQYYFYEIPLNKQAINILLEQAKTTYHYHHIDSALLMYENAKLQSIYTHYSKGVIDACVGISTIRKAKGDYINANKILFEALPYCKDSTTLQEKGFIYNILAVNHSHIGEYQKAADYYTLALDVVKKYPHPDITLEFTYNNLAMLYAVMDMPEKSFPLLQKIDSSIQKTWNPSIRTKSWWTYAYIFNKLKDLEKSKAYLLAMLPILDTLGDNYLKYLSYWKLSVIALNQKKIKDAENYLSLMPEIKNLDPAIASRKNETMASIHYFKKEYRQAIEIMERDLKIVKNSKLLPDIIFAYRNLARTYAANKNYQKAYEYKEIIEELKDSMNKQKQAKNVAIADARFQSAKKDKELAEKELLISQQESHLKVRNITILVSAIVTIILAVLLQVVRKYYRHKQSMRDKQMQLLLKDKELIEIKALMNGEEQERNRIAREIHDGLMIQFSTLKINLAVSVGKQKEFQPHLEQLDKAIAALRSTAHNLMPDMLLEGGLAEAIYYFCENIKELVPFELTFNPLHDIPRFDEKFELSIYRIIQELVQNIIKHAKAQQVYIQMSYRDELLSITIEDDGIGFTSEELENKKGLGLKSIKNRITALQGTIEISSDAENGTSIILECMVIPAQEIIG